MSKSRRSKSFSVGLVSIVALAIIGTGVFLVGREQRFWEGRVEYWLHFSRTNGLQEGAPVALDGVNVGSVSRMRFPPDPTARYIEVRISVSDSVAARIRQSTIAKIQTLGMLGDKYIELTSRDLTRPRIEPGGLILAIDPVDYEAILGQSGDIVTNAIEVTALLRDFLSDVNSGEGLIGRLVGDRDFGQQFADDLSLTIANIESATRRLDDIFSRIERGEGAIGALLVGDEQLADILDNLEVASANAADFSEQLVRGDGTVQRLVSDEELAERLLADVEATTSSLAEISAQVRSGQGTLGKLIYDRELYDNANDMVTVEVRGGFWRFIGNFLSFFWPFPAIEGSGPVLSEPIRPGSPVQETTEG